MFTVVQTAEAFLDEEAKAAAASERERSASASAAAAASASESQEIKRIAIYSHHIIAENKREAIRVEAVQLGLGRSASTVTSTVTSTLCLRLRLCLCLHPLSSLPPSAFTSTLCFRFHPLPLPLLWSLQAGLSSTGGQGS